MEAVANKARETKNCQSYDSVQVVCRLVKPEKFRALLDPLKDVMATSESYKMANKLETVFQNMAAGLNANSAITTVEMLKLIFSLIAENFSLSTRGRLTKAESQRNVKSSYLLGLFLGWGGCMCVCVCVCSSRLGQLPFWQSENRLRMPFCHIRIRNQLCNIIPVTASIASQTSFLLWLSCHRWHISFFC